MCFVVSESKVLFISAIIAVSQFCVTKVVLVTKCSF